MLENGICKNTKIKYSELKELGFKKIEMADDLVHLRIYGYPYFILSYGDEDTLSMEWSPTTREVNLYINSTIFKKSLTLDEVTQIIELVNR